jgi:uncharacterized protein HemX
MKAWLVVLLLAVGLGGYVKGRADKEAQHIATALKQASDAAARAKDNAADEQLRRIAAQSREDQANADPVAVPVCLSVERVRRLALD